MQYFKETEKVKSAKKHSEYPKQSLVNLRWNSPDNCFDLLSNTRTENFPPASRIFSGYNKDLPPHSRLVHLLPRGLDALFTPHFTQRTLAGAEQTALLLRG